MGSAPDRASAAQTFGAARNAAFFIKCENPLYALSRAHVARQVSAHTAHTPPTAVAASLIRRPIQMLQEWLLYTLLDQVATMSGAPVAKATVTAANGAAASDAGTSMVRPLLWHSAPKMCYPAYHGPRLYSRESPAVAALARQMARHIAVLERQPRHLLRSQPPAACLQTILRISARGCTALLTALIIC